MNNISILISSCSKYRDTWKPFIFFMRKYWSECTLSIYLGANGEKYLDMVPEGVQYICTGPDESWSKNLADYLDQIDTKYVLLFLDDFLLTAKPNIEMLERGLELAELYDAPYVRLNANPGPDVVIDENFGTINKYSEYRATLDIAIWDKYFLQQLCAYDFDPWRFERYAGIVDQSLSKVFISANEKYFPRIHFIEKGKYFPMVPDYFREEGFVWANEGHREIMKSDGPGNTRSVSSKGSIKNLLGEILPPYIVFLIKRMKLMLRML